MDSDMFTGLSDDQWDRVKTLLLVNPRRPDGRGRPTCDIRRTLEGILWVLVHQAKWQSIPRDRFGAYQTCHRRFMQWMDDGSLVNVIEYLRLNSDLNFTGLVCEGMILRKRPGYERIGALERMSLEHVPTHA